MESKHTPGPWKVNLHHIGEYTADIEGRDSRHKDDPQVIRTIAVILSRASKEENIANAHFIAAAPETASERDKFRVALQAIAGFQVDEKTNYKELAALCIVIAAETITTK